MKKFFFLPFFITCFLIINPGIESNFSEASKKVVFKGIRYWSSDKYTRVVIDSLSPVQYTQHLISKPDRLYFDLKNCRLPEKTYPTIKVEDGILKRVRTAQFDADTVRVVLDLQSIENYNAFVLSNPDRLVIDVFGKKDNLFTPVKKRAKEFEGIKRIIIDPGHGGSDPGAIGPRGLKEKNVVLAVAKKLGKILKEQYNMEVFFTRTRDVFIPLEERTAIANSKRGDLFISIHTNASRRRNTRGIETYFLNWTTDKEAMRVAARENSISLNKMKTAQGGLQMILLDLERQNKKEKSMALARNVQDSIIDSLTHKYPRIVDLGVKYALFYVLVGAEMPSVLVEVSFISNYDEEKRLSKKKYRDRIAEAIARGISRYSTPTKIVKKDSDNI
jgi:N-acetylmuramoyl-L-alanine amidase